MPGDWLWDAKHKLCDVSVKTTQFVHRKGMHVGVTKKNLAVRTELVVH